MPKITIIPNNVEFYTNHNESILSALLRNGYQVSYGCKNGQCGACKCKIESGNFKLESYNKQVLTQEEKEQGYTLLCKTYAIDDVILNIPNLSKNNVRIFIGKIISLRKYNTTAILLIQLPSGLNFNFTAGQYVEIILKDKYRSYSIANYCKASNCIELHIRYYASGIFSELVFNHLSIGSILRFRGPLGTFGLENSNRTILLVCTGTGFAPVKAIIEELIAKKSNRKIYLFWGNRFSIDAYLTELFLEWEMQLDISIFLCFSQEEKTGSFKAYVTDLISKKFKSLKNFEVYACGNINMIEDVYTLALKLDLDKTMFFSDVFTPALLPNENKI